MLIKKKNDAHTHIATKHFCVIFLNHLWVKLETPFLNFFSIFFLHIALPKKKKSTPCSLTLLRLIHIHDIYENVFSHAVSYLTTIHNKFPKVSLPNYL